jgi:murein DD-endopeptidase MepM/ murein hydrolase activator NlpD
MDRRTCRRTCLETLGALLASASASALVGCAPASPTRVSRAPTPRAPCSSASCRSADEVLVTLRDLVAQNVDAPGEPPPEPFSRAPRAPPLPRPKDASGPTLHNPMPGAVLAGYRADTGLDLAGLPSPVFALGAGRVVYAEEGHTRWNGRGDTTLAVLLALDTPLPFEGRRVTHAWYAHLSAVERVVRPGERARVEAGEKLGTSGRANGSYHLHLGLLLDGETRQSWGSYLLEDEVRRALGGLRHLSRLPALPST